MPAKSMMGARLINATARQKRQMIMWMPNMDINFINANRE